MDRVNTSGLFSKYKVCSSSDSCYKTTANKSYLAVKHLTINTYCMHNTCRVTNKVTRIFYIISSIASHIIGLDICMHFDTPTKVQSAGEMITACVQRKIQNCSVDFPFTRPHGYFSVAASNFIIHCILAMFLVSHLKLVRDEQDWWLLNT